MRPEATPLTERVPDHVPSHCAQVRSTPHRFDRLRSVHFGQHVRCRAEGRQGFVPLNKEVPPTSGGT